VTGNTGPTGASAFTPTFLYASDKGQYETVPGGGVLFRTQGPTSGVTYLGFGVFQIDTTGTYEIAVTVQTTTAFPAGGGIQVDLNGPSTGLADTTSVSGSPLVINGLLTANAGDIVSVAGTGSEPIEVSSSSIAIVRVG
jgi:hypothetical protein